AKARVSHSKALSAQAGERRRRGPWKSFTLSMRFAVSTSSIVRAAPAPMLARCSVERLSRRVPDLRFPIRLDQIYHRVRHRHIVQFGGHFVAILVGPLEEPENFLRVF